jgi:prepilin-type N-terminal cleavage/methylation domain-containing protein
MNGKMIRLVQTDGRLTPFSRTSRRAFTLIELLTVIAIIGVLAGILVPTIAGVVNTARKGALKIEVDELAKAVERYRDKYGDYPPDGSDWGVFQRHIRKAFPKILAAELALLDPTGGDDVTAYPGVQKTCRFTFDSLTVGIRNYMDKGVNTGTYPNPVFLNVMDPAEALVFFLGGFSTDPMRPFTGRGGPFVEIKQADGTSFSPMRYQYNSARENAFFDFAAARLTITQGVADGVAVTVSSDESLYFNADCLPTGLQLDLLPVYISNYVIREENSPYVYFDSRTYVGNKDGAAYFNFYQRSPATLQESTPDLEKYGAIYPMFSDVANTNKKSLPGIPWAANEPLTMYQFMEPTKFQIMGPGLDGKYGGRLVREVREPTGGLSAKESLEDTVFRFPSGNCLNPARSGMQPFRVSPSGNIPINEVDPRFAVRFADNTASFATGSTLDAGGN